MPPLANSIAEAHGLSSWESVESLEFTFYVNREPAVNRHWKWDVTQGVVTRTVDGNSATIELAAIGSEADEGVHRQFINDTFWLLFPFSVVWSGPAVSDHGTIALEIDGEQHDLQKVTALWASDVGYTPGDAYDLYLDKNLEIKGWTFRKANADEGKFFSWKQPVSLGPIKVYESYYLKNADEPFIEMRDLAIQFATSDK
ncbi:MAG TPA: hypothetical protein DCX06_13450 [Opitutae bacterium]|nr:hypothetical protein [Opitutae bacterium]